MKNFLNVFGIAIAFCVGFGFANKANPKIISEEEFTNSCTLVKDALDKAANPGISLANLFEDNYTYYGGELPCIRICCNSNRLNADIDHNTRSERLFFDNTQFKVIRLETVELADVFIAPSALDKYVTMNWVKKWL